MADGVRRLVITIAGESESAERALKRTAAEAEKTEVRVEGFGKAFLKAGVAIEAGQMALGAFADLLASSVRAVADYNQSVDLAERQLRGLLGSQEAANDALAVARAEADRGRGTYQQLAAAMAGLASVARTAGMDLQAVTEIAEILASVNPEEGIKGATFALREAASGDMTSVIERFNLSRTTINRLRAEGVPAIEAVRQAMAEMGYDVGYLNEVNSGSAKQFEILKGELTELAAVAGAPIFEALAITIRELNKESQGGNNGMSFAAILAHDLRAILSGNLFPQLGIEAAKFFVVLADQANSLLKNVSFGKLSLDDSLVEWKNNIIAQQAAIDADIKDKFLGPIGEAIGGKTGPLAPDKMRAAGESVAANFLLGLTGARIGDTEQFFKQFEGLFKDDQGKVNTEAFAAAQDVLARALQDVAQHGQLTAETFYALTATFGDQAINVAALVTDYGTMVAAQDRAAASSEALAEAKRREQQAIADLANRLQPYKLALDEATAAAKSHAEETAAALEPLQDRYNDIGEAAANAARESAALIEGLQEAAAAHAAQNQARIDAAQAELTAASEHRRRESELVQAALRGETEEYLARLPVIDEETRRLAAKYDAMVAGERRAMDAADERVNRLSRQANKEDLAKLREIQAAEDAGDTRKAGRLRKQLEDQRKRRRTDMEVAQAEAAVAKDEYDEAAERAEKEAERADIKNDQAEQAAALRLQEIKDAAEAQAAADQAAIKGAQDAAKAEAARYAAQQRGIQAEIDRINDAAKAQAKKDQQAIADAQRVYDTQKAINDKLASALEGLYGWAERRANREKEVASAAQQTYDTDVKRLPYAVQLAEAAEREAAARERIANTPIAPIAKSPLKGPGNGSTSGTDDNNPGSGVVKNPLLPWQPGDPPSGYHTEKDRDTNQLWWVPDGFHLEDYGKRRDTSLDGSRTSSRNSFLRASGAGGGGAGGLDAPVLGSFSGPALPPGAQGGMNITLNINAPNLTDIGNPAQRRDLAAQSGEAVRRAWGDIVRGG